MPGCRNCVGISYSDPRCRGDLCIECCKRYCGCVKAAIKIQELEAQARLERAKKESREAELKLLEARERTSPAGGRRVEP